MKPKSKILYYLLIGAGSLLVIVFVAAFILLLILGVTYYDDNIVAGILLQVASFGAIPLIIRISKELILFSRQIEIRENGIFVRFPLGKTKFCEWGELQEVSIGYYGDGYGIIGENPLACVFFVKKGEEKTSAGVWNIHHIFGVFYLPHTRETVEVLKEKCPFTITDKRSTLLYKPWWDKDKKREIFWERKKEV